MSSAALAHAESSLVVARARCVATSSRVFGRMTKTEIDPASPIARNTSPRSTISAPFRHGLTGWSEICRERKEARRSYSGLDSVKWQRRDVDGISEALGRAFAAPALALSVGPNQGARAQNAGTDPENHRRTEPRGTKTQRARAAKPAAFAPNRRTPRKVNLCLIGRANAALSDAPCAREVEVVDRVAVDVVVVVGGSAFYGLERVHRLCVVKQRDRRA